MFAITPAQQLAFTLRILAVQMMNIAISVVAAGMASRRLR